MRRFCTGVLSTVAGTWSSARAAELRFIYLTPSDRVCGNEYEAGIEKAAQDLQTWFGQ